MMDPMLNIPQNRKPRNAGRLIVLLGIAALMFILAATRFGSVALVMTTQ